MPGSRQRERELIVLAKRRDAAALGALYRLHRDAVRHYIMKRARADVQLVEDLTAEVFLRLVESIDQFTDRNKSIRSWLFTIARNLLIDHWRTNRDRHHVDIDEALLSTEANQIKIVQRTARARHIRTALSRLTQAQRDVIRLRFGRGLSVAETAAVVQKQEGAVKALQRRALAALRRTVSETSTSRCE